MYVVMFNLWICKIMLGSRVMPTCTWNVIVAFSEEWVAKLDHGVLSSTLER